MIDEVSEKCSQDPHLDKKYGIENPPNAGGGCLLTEPQFGIKAKDLFEHKKNPTINDIDLLKIGRHFRLDEETKFVVINKLNQYFHKRVTEDQLKNYYIFCNFYKEYS